MGEAIEKLSGKLGVDTTDFKTGIAAANRELRVLESGFRAGSASLGDWSKSASGLEMRIKSLTSQIEIQRLKVDALRENYEKIAREQGESSRAAKEAQIAYNKQAEVLGKMERELGQTESALKDVTGETKKAGSAQDKTSLSTGRLTLSLGGLKKMAAGTVGVLASLTKRVASMAVGLAVGAAKIAATTAIATGVLLASTVGPASDLSETLSKTETVFSSMSESVIKNSQAAANQLGINQKKYLDYASALGAAFTAGGMGVQEATALSEQAVKHFADLASFHNAEVEDVAESWQSAIRGSYEPIQKYFPFITNEYLKTYGTAKGLIDENTTTLTANQRAIILNAIALDTQLNPAYGDFERTSDGLANQQRILTAQMENARAKIGSGLLPVVTQLVTMLNKFLSSEAAQAGIEKIKSTLEGLGETIAGVLASFEGREFSLGEFIQKLFGELNLGDLVSNAIGNFDLAGLIGKLFSPDRGLNFLNVGLDIINSIIDSIISGIPNLLPAAQGILQKLVEFLTTGLPVLVQQAVPMLLALITGIVEALPLVLDAALQIILALAQGLTEALPTLLPTIVQVLLALIQTLVDNLPLIIDAALQLILALVQGLLLALPILIAAAPEIIAGLVKAWLEMLPMIGEAALQLIVALAYGIVANIPTVLLAVIELVAAIGRVFYDFILDTPRRGREIIEGLTNGIKSSTGMLYDAITKVVNGMIVKIKSLLGMSSPSRVGKGIGSNLFGSIGMGGEEEAPKIRRMLTRQMLGLANDLKVAVATPGANSSGEDASSQLVPAGATISIGDIHVDARGAKDPEKIGKAVGETLIETLRSKGVI